MIVRSFFPLRIKDRSTIFHESEEIRNRAMESIGKQGEEIAQKSAEVIKSAWSGLMGFFANLTYLAVIPIYLFYFLSSNRNLIDDLEGELAF